VSWAWEKSDVMEVNQEMSVGVKVLLKPKESISSCCCCYCGSSKLDLKCSFPEYSPVITIRRVSLVSEIVSKLNEEKKILQSLANSKFSSLDDQTGNFLKILNRIPYQDPNNVYTTFDGWPLDDKVFLSSLGVAENETVYIVKKQRCHCCYITCYKLMNKMFAGVRYIFFTLLDWFRPPTSEMNNDSINNQPSCIFPSWWTNGGAIFLVGGAMVLIWSLLYQGEEASSVIASSSLIQFLKLQLQFQFGEGFPLRRALQYIGVAAVVFGVLWLFIGFSYYNNDKSRKVSLKRWFCDWIYSRLVQLYVNLPFLSFSLHFISPILLILAYAHNNIDYVTNNIYQPLKDAVHPIIVAKIALKQRRLGSDSSENTFMMNNQTIEIAEQTLNHHAALVVGAAAEVHTVFQMFITTLLSEGSPSIVLYMMSNLIALNGITKIWAWFPRQIKKVAKWANDGMRKDLNLNKMRKEFQNLHLNNACFWLTDYIVIYWSMNIDPGDEMLNDETIVTVMVIGLLIFCLTKLMCQGIYNSEGSALGIIFVFGPTVFKYITGPSMFKVAVWLAVTSYRDPDQVWEYLQYAVVLIEMFKTPRNWKEEMKRRRKNAEKKARERRAEKNWLLFIPKVIALVKIKKGKGLTESV
jgi:hypothetical protein